MIDSRALSVRTLFRSLTLKSVVFGLVISAHQRQPDAGRLARVPPRAQSAAEKPAVERPPARRARALQPVLPPAPAARRAR